MFRLISEMVPPRFSTGSSPAGHTSRVLSGREKGDGGATLRKRSGRTEGLKKKKNVGLHTYTHTHTYIYIYIYIGLIMLAKVVALCAGNNSSASGCSYCDVIIVFPFHSPQDR